MASKIEHQLRALGLNPDDVRELLAERWDQYEALFDPDRPELLFIQGFVEGLMVGALLRQRKGEPIDRDELFDALDYAVAVAQEWTV